jgi:DNA repair protein RecN (Recombination protein N)
VPATLRSLRIRNLALVESLDWDLASGFTVVTGETGAGKSVILGALKLVLGERADKTLIRTGADQCSVEAAFELDEGSGIKRILEDQGIDPCEDGQLLLKRIYAGSGANRQFINGSQTTVAVLKQIGDGLVDLHGPHDHQSLLSTEHQLALIDAFAAAAKLLETYQQEYRSLGKLRKEREELLRETSDANLHLWQHQLQELEAADLKSGELRALQSRYSVVSNARRLLEISGAILRRLSEAEDSVSSQLADIARHLRELNRLDEMTSDFLRSHEAATIELEEFERNLIDYQSRVEIDPEALQRIEERLNLLQALQRKHGRDEEGLIALARELALLVGRFNRRDEALAQIDAQLNATQRRVETQGRELSEARSKAATKLAHVIRSNLKDLGFKQAGFEIQINTRTESAALGFETIEFLFAPNPGEPTKPLRAIASSGEISRLMLAIKTALAQQDSVGLLVFDEIDANVGGEIAHSIGAKMRSLGVNRQVLAITHMPQVAAAATHHFFVSKEVTGGRTRTALAQVAGNQRVEEVARMLGGKTKSAVEHAKDLLYAGGGEPAHTEAKRRAHAKDAEERGA